MKLLLKENKNKYLSCDLNESISADFHCDAIDLLNYVSEQSFDAIIALEVLEHSPRIWQLPEVFYKLLKKNGVLYVSTPFYLYHHDPHPDYWRFTEEGYYELFHKYFYLDITKIIFDNERLKPVHFRVKATKRPNT